MPLSAASPLQLQRQYLREPWLRARHTTSETSNLGRKRGLPHHRKAYTTHTLTVAHIEAPRMAKA